MSRAKHGWVHLDEFIEADPEDVSLGSLIAAFCVFASLVVLVCVYLIVLTPR